MLYTQWLQEQVKNGVLIPNTWRSTPEPTVNYLKEEGGFGLEDGSLDDLSILREATALIEDVLNEVGDDEYYKDSLVCPVSPDSEWHADEFGQAVSAINALSNLVRGRLNACILQRSSDLLEAYWFTKMKNS